MIRTTALCAALLCTVAFQAQAQFGPDVFTTVNPDRTATFRLKAPIATDVQVIFANGFAGPQATAMIQDAIGVWSVTLGAFAPDMYEYSFVIDGVIVTDPSTEKPSPQRAVNTSLLIIPGNPLIDDRNVPHGAIHEELINSKSMKAPRLLLTYTPPNYSHLSDLPVMVLYHGAGDTTYSWVRQGRVAQIFDNYIAQGTIMPMVVIIGETYPVEFDPTHLLGRAIEAAIDEELFTDILPYVEKHYRVRRGGECRAIAGLSMGGGQSVYTALSHPDSFAAVGLFSPAYIGDLPPVDPAQANAAFVRFDMITGTNDFILGLQDALDHNLTATGIAHTYTKVQGGDHSMFIWRPALRDFAAALTQDYKARKFCAR